MPVMQHKLISYTIDIDFQEVEGMGKAVDENEKKGEDLVR